MNATWYANDKLIISLIPETISFFSFRAQHFGCDIVEIRIVRLGSVRFGSVCFFCHIQSYLSSSTHIYDNIFIIVSNDRPERVFIVAASDVVNK